MGEPDYGSQDPSPSKNLNSISPPGVDPDPPSQAGFQKGPANSQGVSQGGTQGRSQGRKDPQVGVQPVLSGPEASGPLSAGQDSQLEPRLEARPEGGKGESPGQPQPVPGTASKKPKRGGLRPLGRGRTAAGGIASYELADTDSEDDGEDEDEPGVIMTAGGRAGHLSAAMGETRAAADQGTASPPQRAGSSGELLPGRAPGSAADAELRRSSRPRAQLPARLSGSASPPEESRRVVAGLAGPMLPLRAPPSANRATGGAGGAGRGRGRGGAAKEKQAAAALLGLGSSPLVAAATALPGAPGSAPGTALVQAPAAVPVPQGAHHVEPSQRSVVQAAAPPKASGMAQMALPESDAEESDEDDDGGSRSGFFVHQPGKEAVPLGKLLKSKPNSSPTPPSSFEPQRSVSPPPPAVSCHGPPPVFELSPSTRLVPTPTPTPTPAPAMSSGPTTFPTPASALAPAGLAAPTRPVLAATAAAAPAAASGLAFTASALGGPIFAPPSLPQSRSGWHIWPLPTDDSLPSAPELILPPLASDSQPPTARPALPPASQPSPAPPVVAREAAVSQTAVLGEAPGNGQIGAEVGVPAVAAAVVPPVVAAVQPEVVGNGNLKRADERALEDKAGGGVSTGVGAVGVASQGPLVRGVGSSGGVTVQWSQVEDLAILKTCFIEAKGRPTEAAFQTLWQQFGGGTAGKTVQQVKDRYNKLAEKFVKAKK